MTSSSYRRESMRVRRRSKLRVCSTCLFGTGFRTATNDGTYGGAGPASPSGLFRLSKGSTSSRFDNAKALAGPTASSVSIFVDDGRPQAVGALPAGEGRLRSAILRTVNSTSTHSAEEPG